MTGSLSALGAPKRSLIVRWVRDQLFILRETSTYCPRLAHLSKKPISTVPDEESTDQDVVNYDVYLQPNMQSVSEESSVFVSVEVSVVHEDIAKTKDDKDEREDMPLDKI